MTPPGSTTQQSSCQCGGRCKGHKRDSFALNLEVPDTPSELWDGAEACQCQHKICPRRYHSIAGLLLGLMLVSHLFINALGLWPHLYQKALAWIQTLGPTLPCLEISIIFIPLLIHVAAGIHFLRKTGLKLGVEKHLHGSDIRFWLQRVTAVILLMFIGFHVLTMHRWGLHWDGFSKGTAAFSFTKLLLAEFYLLGIGAAVYHLANGVATSAEVWGLARTEIPRQRCWHACIAVGIVLGGIGMLAWGAFTKF